MRQKSRTTGVEHVQQITKLSLGQGINWMKKPTRLFFLDEKLYDFQKQQYSKYWSEFQLYQENGCVGRIGCRENHQYNH